MWDLSPMSATWSLVVIWQKPGIRKSEFVSLCKNVMVNFNGECGPVAFQNCTVGIESKCPSAKAQGNSNESIFMHLLTAFRVGCDRPELKHVCQAALSVLTPLVASAPVFAALLDIQLDCSEKMACSVSKTKREMFSLEAWRALEKHGQSQSGS